MATLIRQLRKTDEGAELIEMAIVLPLLLLLIMGMVDFGFLFQQYVVLTNAAAEGARVASLPGYSAADVTQRVQDYAATGGVKGTVNATSDPYPIVGPGGSSWPGSKVTVTHNFTFNYIGPIMLIFGKSLGSNTVTITTQSIVRHQVAAAP